MTDSPIVVAEITEVAPKENFVKKLITEPKKLAVAAGVALALVAGVIVFAVKRMDEDDFDDEFPTDSTTPADVTEAV